MDWLPARGIDCRLRYYENLSSCRGSRPYTPRYTTSGVFAVSGRLPTLQGVLISVFRLQMLLGPRQVIQLVPIPAQRQRGVGSTWRKPLSADHGERLPRRGLSGVPPSVAGELYGIGEGVWEDG